jgi:hypothetical protein
MSNLAKLDPQQEHAAPVNDNTALMTAVARAASDPTVDVEKMERLFAMHERMTAKQAEVEFNTAMSRVQSGMRRIETDKHNKQTNSGYASYGQLDRVLRPLYTAEGLSLSFDTQEAPEGSVGMVCHVSHSGGHTRTYRAVVPSDGKGAKGGDVMTRTHAFGSGTAYGMRYLLKMIFNVAIGVDLDDDDGNGASDQILPKDAAWIAKVTPVQDYAVYVAMKAEMLADYGGLPANIPHAVREAFNVTAAATKPKD